MTSKKNLSERDICTQYILPAITKAGWNLEKQVREEVFFTDGRIFVKGNKTARGERKRADIILYHKPNIPIAVVEAKERINEEFGKQFFTIMDFRNVTDLFADPTFDGDPVMVKKVAGEDELAVDDIFDDGAGDEIVDPETGEAVDFGESDEVEWDGEPVIVDGGSIVDEPRKIYVSGVDVSILNERVQHLDADGNPITESLREYTRKGILREFRSLEDFLTTWNDSDRKTAIIEELERHGVIIENLKEEIARELDVFDLICHVAWDMPPMSRRERAENVRKRNYFTRYGEKARAVLDALLDKYATEGIEDIEDIGVLRVEPVSGLGTPAEIVGYFGGKDNHFAALKELEREIYRTAA